MQRRSLVVAVFAIATVALYIGSMVVGGAIVPGYSHIENSVSELTSSAGAHRWGLAWGFSSYNVTLAAMGIGLARAVRRSRALITGLCLWLVVAVAGVLQVSVFPQDPMGQDVTPKGTGHLILAGVAAAGLIVSAFFWAKAFKADAGWSRLARPSFWFGWAILAIGGLGAALGGIVPSLFGLGERFTMVTYLGWFTVIAVVALRRPTGRAPQHYAP